MLDVIIGVLTALWRVVPPRADHYAKLQRGEIAEGCGEHAVF